MKKSLPLRTRLFLNYLAILLLGMGLAAILVWRSVETLYIETQRENLLTQAELTAAALPGTLMQNQVLYNSSTQPYLQTSNTLPGIHTRLLSEQGAVVYSLPLQADNLSPVAEDITPISPQQLQLRPEIAQAMQGQSATAIRAVSGRPILYAAAPVFGNDGKTSAIVYLAMPLPASGLPLDLVWKLAAAAISAILLALVAGTVLANYIISPVETIASAAGAVSAGNLDQQVPVESAIDELNSLGLAFNQMTASLRQAERAQNAFVADVTHELRTPLTVIKGTIETLEDGALDDLQGRGQLLSSMQHETNRLIRLVNDLLVLTRADSGTLNMEILPLNLAELARARCAQLATLATRQKMRLVVTGADPACVLGDVDRISQVLDNLLDNAMHYSPSGSEIKVEISSNSAVWLCAVSDCGSGIPEKDLPFIFERFFRVDSSRNRRTGGAGLGLAIARALVQAQGGQITARSIVGAGTSIQFSLPRAGDCPSTD